MARRAPDDLGAELARLAEHRDVDTWRPRYFDLSRAADRRALAALLEQGVVVECCDAYARQLAELVRERHPAEALNFDAAEARAEPLLEGRPPALHGRWIFYPWSGRLVHVLPPDEFRELRSMRNRDKITTEEQTRLRRAKVGVVGLSVGRAAAATLALEGVGGEIRLADPDVLDLTNLNRLRTGVHALGVNKAVLAARELAEIDPFLAVRIFPEGLSDETLDAFLTDGGRLDLLVEECDDIYMKFRVRERCRELGIPVVMETSDRGLLDVERFDLEPDRPPFHGLVGDIRADELRGAPRDRVVEMVNAIIDRDAISERMKASMAALGRTLRTWPQLASDVALGGAAVTLVARRVLLGQMTGSGRFYVDPEQAIARPVAGTDRPPVGR